MEKTTTVTITVSWQDFLDFLDSRGLHICDSFLIQLKAANPPLESIQAWINYPETWLISSLYWGGSLEGHDFWSNINRLWGKQFADATTVVSTATIEDINASLEKCDWTGYVGRWMKVVDFSYNRDALPEWEKSNWKYDSYVTEIACSALKTEEEHRVLILEPPVMKIMKGYPPFPMVKVWVPKLKKVHWFIFSDSWVLED